MPTPAYQVRPATPTDARLIVEFQLLMAHESEGLVLERPTLASGVEAVLSGAVEARYWLAEQAGQPMGMLMTVPEWSDWRNGTVLWVHSVYVDPVARRQGVFAAMYDHLRAMVELSDDLVGLRLYVDKGNESAQRVYEAMGMTREHYHLYEWLK
jgi:GNAT superfamily N-acetyltransferase